MAKILIVDDAKFSRHMISVIMIDDGHETIEACDGKEGLDMLIAEKPDLVITDLLMPVLDGQGLLAAIQEQKLGVPVIVSTSNIQKTVQEKCQDLGCSAFVSKPPVKEHLQQLVRKILVSRGA